MTFLYSINDAESAEISVGVQFRQLRLARAWDQSQLAGAAGVSLSSIKNLEQGKGSTLKTLAKVALALDRGEWLKSVAPAATISPIEVLRQGRRPARRRVYRARPGGH